MADDWPGTPVAPVAGAAPRGAYITADLPGLHPDLLPIVKRESGGKPFVGYTPPGMPLVDLSNAPLDETGFPQWSGNRDPSTGLMSHAAGIGQFQPGTWRPIAQKLGIHDFSLESQIKVANELRAEQGLKPWAASAWPGATVSAGDWKISPETLAYEGSRKDSHIVWMGPDEYKQMVQKDETPEDRPKSRSLARSLAQGDHVESLPELTVKNGRVVDQDGWRRAQAAEDAGVDLIPVAIRGIAGPPPEKIQNMRGEEVRFDFKPVEAPKSPVNLTGMPGLGVTPPDQTGSWQERFGTGIKDVGVGLAQLGAHLPIPEMPRDYAEGQEAAAQMATAADRSVQARERQIEAERAAAGQTGTDWWRVAGNMAGTAPLMAAGAGAGLGVGGAALMGAVGGMVGAAAAPVTTGAPYGPAKGAQLAEGGGIGAFVGGGGNQLARLMRPIIAPYVQTGISKIENAARNLISQRFADRAAGTGATPDNMLSLFSGARREGQPMTLADLPELAGLAGAVSRVPGEAGGRIRSFFQGRRGEALDRLDNILSRYLPTGSVKRTIDTLADERSAAAAPVYAEAFAGGSIAPLEKQFQSAWNTASATAKAAEQNVARLENEMTAAAARQSQAGNVYASSGANRSAQFSQDKLAEQRVIASEAREAEESSRDLMRRAQADGTANAPGAIWSPVIQRLVSNPRVRTGINRGIKIERDLADAEGRPMRLSEYAVLGTDAAGDPIVGAVPNMRLLAAGKKGLDAMVADMRHKEPPWRLTEEGRAVNALRKTLVDELYRLNPKYKEANEIWSGGAQAIHAVTDGERALNRSVSVDDVRQQLDALPAGARDLYRLGVADDARKDLLNASVAGDKSKAIVNSEAAREKLRIIIGTPENAERFINAIENERAMFNTERAVTGGSQTAERLAEDGDRNILAALHFGRAGIDAVHGSLPSAALAVARGVRDLRRDNRLINNPELANEVARLLTDPRVSLRNQLSILPQLPRTAPDPSTPARNALAELSRSIGVSAAPGAAAAAVGSQQ